MVLQKRLAGIEVVSHIGRNIMQRQPQRMGVHELDIGQEMLGRPEFQPAPDSGQIVDRVVAGYIQIGALVLSALSNLHVQCCPLGKVVQLEWLDPAAWLWVVNVDSRLTVQARLLSQRARNY